MLCEKLLLYEFPWRIYYHKKSIFYLDFQIYLFGQLFIFYFHNYLVLYLLYIIVLYGILSIIRTSEIHLFYNLQVFYWHFHKDNNRHLSLDSQTSLLPLGFYLSSMYFSLSLSGLMPAPIGIKSSNKRLVIHYLLYLPCLVEPSLASLSQDLRI